MTTNDAFDAVIGGRRGRDYVAPTASQLDRAWDELDSGARSAALALVTDAAAQRAIDASPEVAELAEELCARTVEHAAEAYEEETLGAAALLTLSRELDVIRNGNRVHIVTARHDVDFFLARLEYACGGSEEFETNAREGHRLPAGGWTSVDDHLRCPPCARSAHAQGLDDHDRLSHALLEEAADTAARDLHARLTCSGPPATLEDLEDAAYDAWTQASASALAERCVRASEQALAKLLPRSHPHATRSGHALTNEDWRAVCSAALTSLHDADPVARVRAELASRIV